MRRKVLLIAFHFPPCGTSSGLQRTLAYARHLPSLGWEPTVLSVNPRVYDHLSRGQLKDIPETLEVVRTIALDSARDLSIAGRHWARLGVPDRWRSWWVTAVPAALVTVRRRGIEAIWSTYPVATAHSIGATTARLSGLPWIADFRDPLVEYLPDAGGWFPKDARLRQARLRIEAVAARNASRLVFCTEAARQIILDRYPDLSRSRTAVIPNGYDEQAFCDAQKLDPPPKQRGKRLLLHSGTVYPGSDRDPTALMEALRGLIDRKVIQPGDFELRLRDPSNEGYFRELAERIGVADVVTTAPRLDYRESLAEMLTADGLLLLQGYTSNPAVPAKLYEYLRTGRPIVGLVHPDGESARTLRDAGIGAMASLTDAPAIGALIEMWLRTPDASRLFIPRPDVASTYSREHQAAQLAALLSDVVNRKTQEGSASIGLHL